MRPRLTPVVIAGTAIALAVLIAAGVAFLRSSGPRKETHNLSKLRERRAVLQDSLAAMAARDPLLEIAKTDSSEITLALSEVFLGKLLQEITTRYLDRVVIDLGPGVTGRGKGDLDIQTPFGQMTVGKWKVLVSVRQFGGILGAGEPRFEISGTNRVHLAVPVRIQRGRGEMTLSFEWNSNSIFNIVCRDFKTVQVIRGTVLPQEHIVMGDLILSAADRGIVVDPELPRQKFPISMALDKDSWKQVREALKDQDKLLRCGLLINPDSVISRLQKLGEKGLRFKLPKVFFRTVTLPAGVTRSVRILNSSVEIVAVPRGLRISPGLVWFGADVKAQRSTDPGQRIPLPGATE